MKHRYGGAPGRSGGFASIWYGGSWGGGGAGGRGVGGGGGPCWSSVGWGGRRGRGAEGFGEGGLGLVCFVVTGLRVCGGVCGGSDIGGEGCVIRKEWAYIVAGRGGAPGVIGGEGWAVGAFAPVLCVEDAV